MMITQQEMKRALDRLEPRSWRGTDYRKMPSGRILRFIDWKRLSGQK